MKKNIIVLIIFFIVLLIVGIYTAVYQFDIMKDTDNKESGVDSSDKRISKYNNPIVPNGFNKLETDTASWSVDESGVPKGWNDGLVIEDSIGNQFVWIPVKNIDNTDILEELRLLSDSEINDIDENVKEQVKEYGGFYVARYEAGVPNSMQNNLTNISGTTNDIEGIPVSKKDRLPWNYITLKNAKLNAQNMYSNSAVKSDLITVAHSLYITRWLIESGYNIDESEKFGNFVNSKFTFTGYYSSEYDKENNHISYIYGENKTKQTYNMILSTGASEFTKTNNIYDLAGNLLEFTDTYSKDRGYFSIGGYYGELPDRWSFCPRNIGDKTPLEKLGFRVVLYLI